MKSYVFWVVMLIAFGLALTFYVGLQADASTLGTAAVNVINALQLRAPGGQLVAYPKTA